HARRHSAARRTERGGEPADGALDAAGVGDGDREAPLLDMASSTLGGNIDPKQMSELPVQGRDWMSLALLAPGNRTTAMGGAPVQDRTASGRDIRELQLNLDGQQVTGELGPAGQPPCSRDAIADFQLILNRLD